MAMPTVLIAFIICGHILSVAFVFVVRLAGAVDRSQAAAAGGPAAGRGGIGRRRAAPPAAVLITAAETGRWSGCARPGSGMAAAVSGRRRKVSRLTAPPARTRAAAAARPAE